MPLQKELILGINANGVSFNIEILKIDDDQSKYEYICNVSESSSSNGNGSYSINIVNKELIKGLPVGKWTLLEGHIQYDWGASDSFFTMIDERGENTNIIFASAAKGSASGFNIEALTRAIFTKAREIVSEYPSARIYNSCASFLKHSKRPSQSSLQRYLEREDSIDAINTFIKQTLNPLVEYIQLYKKTIEILEREDDIRSARLLDKVHNECYKTIQSLNRSFDKE